MPLTDQDVRAVVHLAKRIRDDLTGARKWDEQGIAAAVVKVKHLHLADVVLAAARAADDRSLEKPGAIGNPAAHCWRERATDRPVVHQAYDAAAFCWCGTSLAGHPPSDHEPQRADAARAEGLRTPVRVGDLRAIRDATAAELCRHLVPATNCNDCRPITSTEETA